MTFWDNGQVFDGHHLTVPVDDAGLRFGATVFTTLRVYGHDLHHPLTQWQGHCDRLKTSLQTFGWKTPNWFAVHQGCQQLKRQYPILRITLFPNGREWITGRPLPPALAHHQQAGVACWVAPASYARSLPTHKTGNYLACWLARQQAQQQGAHDAILTNAQGDWLETSTGNLWGWREGQWWTPKGEHCLPGLMQRRLQQLLRENGHPVSCLPWRQWQVTAFDAIAYSNCVVGLLPIHTILNGATKLEYDPQHASIQALQRQLSELAC